jgi:hypothetical protein
LGDLPLPPPPPLPATSTAAAVEGTDDDYDSNDAQNVVSSQTGYASVATGSSMEGGGDMEGPTAAAASSSSVDNYTNNTSKSKDSSKKQKIKDFVLPPHLVPNEADTEKERNKKRRAAKALKSKWRLQKKEVESANRQKSWQSFQKKTVGKRKDDTIFATKEDPNDRVGVVSKKKMTEFGARKRHKHI